MTVYIVVKEHYCFLESEFEIIGVYDTEEKAIQNKPEDDINGDIGDVYEIIKKEIA